MTSNTLTENLALKATITEKIKLGIPEWMLKQISKDLSICAKTGITKAMMQRTLQQDPLCLVLFKIENGKISVRYNQNKDKQFQIEATSPIIFALQELNSYISLPNIQFIYCFDDAPFSSYYITALRQPPNTISYVAPVFTSCKRIQDKNAVLIPDFHTLNSIKNNIIEKIMIGNAKYPWTKKINKAFWRGSTTGGFYRMHNYMHYPRTKLVKLSADPSKFIDAKFNHLWAIDDPTKKKFFELNYIGETVEVSEHINYKYQILIDGNSASWPRAYWQFQSNSVVFKQNSNYIVWHHELFKPWLHFIPFDYYCSDLIEKINWAIKHDNEAKQIAERANKIAFECLQYSDILVYFYALIIEYAKLKRY